jgi:hypothetical protein
MNEKQKEELFFEIRNRIVHVENVVIAIAKYLANVEDILVKLLTEVNTYETLLEQLRKE